MEQPTCKTCPYWDDLYAYVENDHEGGCRRNPPQMVSQRENQLDAEFPATNDDDWCGEHPDFPAYIASLKQAHADTRHL